MPPIIIRYLASAFVEARSITPNTQAITALLGAFGETQLLPHMMQKLGPSGITQQMAFKSSDDLKHLVLDSNRFDFTSLTPLPPGDGLENYSEFCEEATRLLLAALNYFGRVPHRLATVHDSVLVELSEEEKSSITDRLLRVPDVYNGNGRFITSGTAMPSIEAAVRAVQWYKVRDRA